MADEQQPSKAKELFEQHGEKLAVGGAAFLLLVYLVVGVVIAEEDPAVTQLGVIAERIDQESGKSHENAAQLQAPYEKVSAQALDPWTKISSADRGSDWAGSVFTMVDVKGRDGEIVVVKGVRVPDVVSLKTDVGFDGVVLAWEQGDVDEKKYEAVAVKEFLVERRDPGGAWKELKRVDAKTLTYQDKAIKPKTKYEYRVTSLADTKRIPDGRGQPSAAVAVSTLGIWKFTIITAMKGMVRIEIEKFDAKHGKVRIARTFRPGDTIGWWPEKDGEEPTSKHSINVEGKSVEIDWDTKSKIDKCDERVFKNLTRKVCEAKLDSSAGSLPHEPEIVKLQDFKSLEIIYTDPDEPARKITVLRPDPKDIAYLQDEICPDHGGPKKEPPKEDTAAAEKRKKEKDAEKLFDEAEKLHDEWEKLEKDKKPDAAKKKGESLEKFKKVMSDFGGTDFVNRKKKTIEERIKKLGG